MTTIRPKLGLKPTPADADPVPLLTDAIATRRAIEAVYNRDTIRLAPHVLYRRDDTLFLDGVVMQRNGAPPREAKLGAFRLTGLTRLRMAPDSFAPIATFDPAEERYGDNVVAIVTR
ncbi:hypothetical protein PQ455_15485 [Sphingomonas naphthae]|uniref:WYL domain-containing protein n=1 Tax=Sphingomonas naphthae TaxID=1813468 RepID=A0ABY7TL96_9SPHN|nr:hypothetical protein [Sphingomonas naphthae]WCT73019.1 hypothetical protein PQ455_15485 [Sphingomonas naphthae]